MPSMQDTNTGSMRLSPAITIKSGSKEVQLSKPVSICIHTELGSPFISGNFTFSQEINEADVAAWIDKSIVTGTIRLSSIKNSDSDASYNAGVSNGFMMQFDYVVTSFKIFPVSLPSRNVTIQVSFIDSSIFSFNSTIPPFSTGGSDQTPLDILKGLFFSVGLTLNPAGISTSVKIPFITSANENLFTATEYLLRRSYDERDIQNTSFVTITRNPMEKDIKLWSLSDSLTRNMNIPFSNPSHIIGDVESRYIILDFSDTVASMTMAMKPVVSLDFDEMMTNAYCFLSGKKTTDFSYSGSSFAKRNLCSMNEFSESAFFQQTKVGALNKFSTLKDSIPGFLSIGSTGYFVKTSTSRNNYFLYDGIRRLLFSENCFKVKLDGIFNMVSGRTVRVDVKGVDDAVKNPFAQLNGMWISTRTDFNCEFKENVSAKVYTNVSLNRTWMEQYMVAPTYGSFIRSQN